MELNQAKTLIRYLLTTKKNNEFGFLTWFWAPNKSNKHDMIICGHNQNHGKSTITLQHGTCQPQMAQWQSFDWCIPFSRIKVPPCPLTRENTPPSFHMNPWRLRIELLNPPACILSTQNHRVEDKHFHFQLYLPRLNVLDVKKDNKKNVIPHVMITICAMNVHYRTW